MQDSDAPPKIPKPFAVSAAAPYDTYPIATVSQIGISPGRASFETGFVPLNFTAKSAGGVPPFGADWNGLLRQTTAGLQWVQAGGPATFDVAFSTAIGGYPQGALVVSAITFGLYWLSTVDNNTSNPDAGGANWLPILLTALSPRAIDYYLSPSGSDSNNGSSGSPWLTLPGAYSNVTTRTVFTAGTTVRLHLADGTYTAGFGAFLGNWEIIGHSGSPSSVVISPGGASTPIATNNSGTSVKVSGVKFVSASPAYQMAAFFGSTISFSDCDFGAGGINHIVAFSGGTVVVLGNYAVTGSPATGGCHYFAQAGNIIASQSITPVVVTGAAGLTFGDNVTSHFGFATVEDGGYIHAIMSTFTGFSGVTGPRFGVFNNSVIQTNGGAAGSYFPGSFAGNGTAGTPNATGGLYV